jgi:predicted permease
VSYGAPDVLQGGSWRAVVQVPGSARTEREPVQSAIWAVGPHLAETIGSKVMGRDIAATDTSGSERVALVNQAFVREFLNGDRHAVGRVFTLKMDKPSQVSIVGVVDDLAHSGLRKKPEPSVYVPAAQFEPPMSPAFVVRAGLPAAVLLPAVRREVGRLGSGVSLIDLTTVQQRLESSMDQDRLLATLAEFFGGLALLLAAVGLYGVVAYTTARRTREIGVRMALGAQRRSVVWLVLRDALAMVGCGLALGLPLALAAGRAVRSILFGIAPGDPLAFGAAAAVLAVIGAAAAFIPARRAAGVDPSRVLRVE